MTLTASIPIAEVKKTNEINLNLGGNSDDGLNPEKGTRLENIVDLNLRDASKGVLRQLKNAMDKSGMTELAKKGLVKVLGLAVKAALL